MKRRGFLGMLGGAAVAGPAMAKEAAVQLAGLATPGIGAGAGANLAGNIGFAAKGRTIGRDAEWDPLADAKRDLARLLGKSASELAKERRAFNISALDPDLAVARSFSLDFKYRTQQSRMHARMVENERTWIERRIADLMS